LCTFCPCGGYFLVSLINVSYSFAERKNVRCHESPLEHGMCKMLAHYHHHFVFKVQFVFVVLLNIQNACVYACKRIKVWMSHIFFNLSFKYKIDIEKGELGNIFVFWYRARNGCKFITYCFSWHFVGFSYVWNGSLWNRFTIAHCLVYTLKGVRDNGYIMLSKVSTI